MKDLTRMAGCILLLVALGALVGCAGFKDLQTVKVAVPVECRASTPDRPVMPTEALQPGVALDRLVAASLAEIDLREGYEIKLVAALASCTRPMGPVEGGRRGQ